MGKFLVIKGANFSTNALAKEVIGSTTLVKDSTTTNILPVCALADILSEGYTGITATITFDEFAPTEASYEFTGAFAFGNSEGAIATTMNGSKSLTNCQLGVEYDVSFSDAHGHLTSGNYSHFSFYISHVDSNETSYNNTQIAKKTKFTLKYKFTK